MIDRKKEREIKGGQILLRRASEGKPGTRAEYRIKGPQTQYILYETVKN